MKHFSKKLRYWICRSKSWLVHKLGGYMPHEVILDASRVKAIKMTYTYTADMLRAGNFDVHTTEKANALKKFTADLWPFVQVESTKDAETNEYVLRLMMQVVTNGRRGDVQM